MDNGERYLGVISDCYPGSQPLVMNNCSCQSVNGTDEFDPVTLFRCIHNCPLVHRLKDISLAHCNCPLSIVHCPLSIVH